MLSKKDIEELATGAVKRYFNTCNLISPQIQENDKTPDWDGYLNIYKEKKDVRRNFIGCIRIQVKGIQVNDFKKTESFPIETVFLNNARSEGFVFFVVEVKEDGTSTIFYRMMAPIEIRAELSKLKNDQKTKNFHFEILDSDKDFITRQLAEFLIDCIKQKSFAIKDEFKIEDIKDATEYQWGFTMLGKKENFAKDIFDGFKSFLYAKTKEGVEIPVGYSRMTVCIPEITGIQQEPVVTDNIIANEYTLKYSKDFITYEIQNLLSFKILNNVNVKENNVTIDILAKTTEQYIEAYSIFLSLLRVRQIKFGSHCHTLKTKNTDRIISDLENRISNFKKHAEVIKVLNIKTPLDYGIFSKEDNKSILQLHKALIEHQPIGLNKPKAFFKLDIANICILLTCQSDGNGKFYIDDFFKNSNIKVSQDGNKKPFLVPIFSFLEKLGYVLFDNIPYDKILDSYKEFVDIDSRVYTQANLDLLEMLKAADELQNKQMLSKRKITLNTALELAQWLIENDKQTSLTDIHLINYLQTTKRLRDLTDEERKPLIKMTQSSEPMVRAAANILLGDTDVAKYIIENMKNDDKIIFVNFPIYHLLLK